VRLVDQTIVRLRDAAMSAVATCVAASACLAGIQYDIRFLSPPPGGPPSSPPRAINNAGVIVGGDSYYYEFDSPAVRWDPGATVATRLTGLGGVNFFGKTHDVAWGINDSGTIVGWGISADNQSKHALRWEPGATVATDIGGGGPTSQAYDINNAGAVVGPGEIRVGSGSGSRPVYWAPGATTFTVLPGTVVINGVDYTANARVNGINDGGVMAGEVAGYAGGAAVTWSPPYTNFTYLPDLPGSPVTHSADINNNGMVVGHVGRDSGLTYHGFRYDPATGTMSELLGRPGIDPEQWSPSTSPLQIFASAVNADGVAVGRAGFINYEHAVTWLPGSTHAVDLNSLIDPGSGWVLTNAWDINDAGQIIGSAISSSRTFGFYVLTPVPEPGVMGPALVALAAARFLPRSRRRTRAAWRTGLHAGQRNERGRSARSPFYSFHHLPRRRGMLKSYQHRLLTAQSQRDGLRPRSSPSPFISSIASAGIVQLFAGGALPYAGHLAAPPGFRPSPLSPPGKGGPGRAPRSGRAWPADRSCRWDSGAVARADRS
jgi:uncharacterized membrane protein